MSRSGYNEDGDYDQWANIMWRGQVASAMRGKRGQAFLRELVVALDAMPIKRLIANDLVRDGEVCALGAVGVKRGVEMSKLDPEDFDTLGNVFGIAHQMIQEIEWVNDEAAAWNNHTPENRWIQMRAWASQNIREET